MSPALAGRFFTTSAASEALRLNAYHSYVESLSLKTADPVIRGVHRFQKKGGGERGNKYVFANFLFYQERVFFFLIDILLIYSTMLISGI